jgi:hypothetical protein
MIQIKRILLVEDNEKDIEPRRWTSCSGAANSPTGPPGCPWWCCSI